MRAALKIEAINDSSYQYFDLWTNILNDGMPGLGDLLGLPKKKYWVAEIIGKSKQWQYERRFLRPRKDYREANAIGSRGVYIWYILESGKYYEVNQPVSWRRTERYYCRVTDLGEIERLTKTEVDKWTENISV